MRLVAKNAMKSAIATRITLPPPSSTAGNSVCLFVHGFEPYFYVEAPTQGFSPDDCRALVDMLNVGSLD